MIMRQCAMPKRSSTKKPKEDFSQTAFRVVQEATTEKKPDEQAVSLDCALNDERLRKEVMRAMGRRGGAKGGAARAFSLSQERRKEIARKAADARWHKNEE